MKERNKTNKTNKLKIFTAVTLIGAMLPQFTFAAQTKEPAQPTHKVISDQNNQGETVKILVFEKDKLYDKDLKIHNLRTIGIDDEMIFVKATRCKHGYEFVLKGKIYSLPDPSKVRELKPVKKQPSAEITVYGEYDMKPSRFGDIKPRYGSTNISEQAVERFKELNKDNKDFEKEIKNAVQTIYELNLSYGGNLHNQGDLSDGKTMCDGFTWIFSELLKNSHVKYRYVLASPTYEKEKKNELLTDGDRYWHIYNEVYNPSSQKWMRLENTALQKDTIDSAIGKTFEEKLNNYYKNNFTESILLQYNKVWYLNDNDIEPYKKDFYISSAYVNGNIVDPTCYKVIYYNYDVGELVDVKLLAEIQQVIK